MVLDSITTKWDELTASYDISDRLLFVVTLILVHHITFWGMNITLYFFHKFNLFTNYKIQNAKYPEGELAKDCLKHCLFNHLIIHPIMLYFIYPLYMHFGMSMHGPLPDWMTLLRWFVVCIIINDTGFYWAHRTVHLPIFYAKIHKKHHKFKTPIGISSEYANPIEDVVANIIPTVAGCMLQGTHFLFFIFWMIIRVMETVDAHSGYKFPLSPFNFLPFIGGAEPHDYHHSINMGCYGSFFTFWDDIMGTNKHYKEWKEKGGHDRKKKIKKEK